MNITKTLFNELAVTLAAGAEEYIRIARNNATCLLSVELLDAGAAYKVQATLFDPEKFTSAEASSHADLSWENIVVDGVEYAELSFALKPAIELSSPAILYVKNTSSGAQRIRVTMRGNK